MNGNEVKYPWPIYNPDSCETRSVHRWADDFFQQLCKMSKHDNGLINHEIDTSYYQ